MNVRLVNLFAMLLTDRVTGGKYKAWQKKSDRTYK